MWIIYLSWWRRTWGIALVSVSWRSLAFRWRAVCYYDTWEPHHYIDCTVAINKCLGRVLRVTFTYFLLVCYQNKSTKIDKYNFTKHNIEPFVIFTHKTSVTINSTLYKRIYSTMQGSNMVYLNLWHKNELAKNRIYTHIHIVGWIWVLTKEQTMGSTFMILLIITKNFGKFTCRSLGTRRVSHFPPSQWNYHNPWTIYQMCTKCNNVHKTDFRVYIVIKSALPYQYCYHKKIISKWMWSIVQRWSCRMKPIIAKILC